MTGLSVRGLTVGRGTRLVLEDVSFSARVGCITAVLGAAGSGKTSLFAAVAGLLAVERGAVLVGGADVTKMRPGRRGVALLAPGTEIPPARKLADALRRIAGRGRGDTAGAVQRSFRLDGLAGQPVGLLSHGEALAALTAARLVAGRAADGVLLVDEAGSGLDAAAREHLAGLLRERARQGATVVIATRDRGIALAADHLVVLDQGRLVQSGTPASVYAEPGSMESASMTGHANGLRGTIRELRPGGFVWTGGGRFLQTVDPETTRPALGTEFTLCLRPERMVLLRPDERADNRLDATVLDVRSAGALLDARLETSLGMLRVLCPSWQPTIYPVAGQALRVGWAPDAGVVLTDPTG